MEEKAWHSAGQTQSDLAKSLLPEVQKHHSKEKTNDIFYFCYCPVDLNRLHDDVKLYSCTPRNYSVNLREELRATNAVFFPRCLLVKRCGGNCGCGTNNWNNGCTCQASKTTPKLHEVGLIRWRHTNTVQTHWASITHAAICKSFALLIHSFHCNWTVYKIKRWLITEKVSQRDHEKQREGKVKVPQRGQTFSLKTDVIFGNLCARGSGVTAGEQQRTNQVPFRRRRF